MEEAQADLATQVAAVVQSVVKPVIQIEVQSVEVVLRLEAEVVLAEDLAVAVTQ